MPEWIYKDKGVKVGYGSYKNKCDREKFYCAGGKLFGKGSLQAQAVKKAIANGGIHPDKVFCTLGKYWCKQLQRAGLVRNDAGRVSYSKGVWYFKGETTKVGQGSWKKACDNRKLFCAGKSRFGFGIQQAQAVKEAILNGGLHPDMEPCPLSKYWCTQMQRAGIRGRDIAKLKGKSGEWLFHETSLKVGYGSYKKTCDSVELFCAGGAKYGSGAAQALAVKAAIENGGLHPSKANYRSYPNYCVYSNGKNAQQDRGRVTSNVGACETTCDRTAGCTGYEWFAKGYKKNNCYLFINKPVAMGKSGKRFRDAECFVKKARRCIVFDNWRKKWLGKHVEINLGKNKYGAKMKSWKDCLELCEAQKECKQVVFTKGLCYGMLARSDLDQDNKGGKNSAFISAHCYDKDVLHKVRTCSECGKTHCSNYMKNGDNLESFYMMGSTLRSWGCGKVWLKPYRTVRSSGRVYVVENQAEQVESCAFLTPHFEALGQALCEDGKYVKDWSCMKGGHGQRFQCPADAPTMCTAQTCGSDKKDFCCAKSCEKLGGPRTCSQGVTYYSNDKALSWYKLQDKCESHGKRLCTYSELCSKKGRRPRGGLQSSSDAWCPILDEDLRTPNYVQVGVNTKHPTCQRLTDSHSLSATAWPFNDRGAVDLREVYGCCEGWTTKGIRFRGALVRFRERLKKDRLTIRRGKRWGAKNKEIYYQKLPSYLSASWPLRGTKDINSANQNSLYLPQTTLAYLLRVDRWSKVDLKGWTDTGDVGSYLGTHYYKDKVRIYWKILDAGKHIIDNYSGMYLFASAQLPTCLGVPGNAIPTGFVWPEKYPKKFAASVEEVWANNRAGLYGKKVQGMKFAALTLKEKESNGGTYYILFSNKPPSDPSLPGSDCSAGTTLKYGTKPKSKVRLAGDFVPTWQGTTWKIYLDAEPWQPFGGLNAKCGALAAATSQVADKSDCQMKALTANHPYFQFLAKDKEPALCATSSTCDAPITGQKDQWQIYSKHGTFFSYGDDTSCRARASEQFVGNGHCANGQIYSSAAWAMAESKFGKKGFETAQYKAWVKTAWSLCLARDPQTTFVSVWMDAGYRCYKTLDCKANNAGQTRSWSGAGLGKAFVHLRSFSGAAVGRSFLHSWVKGNGLMLKPQDDLSGRQRWVISKGKGNWYYIRVLGGTTKRKTYLSSSKYGKKVFLHDRDDRSGRQRWKIRPFGTAYQISVLGGVRGKRRLLSTNTGGTKVALWTKDDDSGRQRWNIGAQADAEYLTSWAETNFNNRGNKQLSVKKTYFYRLGSGHLCGLSGWTHTRTYARGFLRAKRGNALAVVVGLEPGAEYVWRIYQSASLAAGKNGLTVNGIAEGSTVSFNTIAAKKRGMSQADMKGRIVFTFARQSHHVQLSALSVKRRDEAVDEYLTTLDENHFNDRKDSTLSMSGSYTYRLGNGYPCVLTGWTHTRTYAHGFLRNKPGLGLAVVSGLEPGAEYAWRVYQYAARFAGKNELIVNGDSKGQTTSSKAALPRLGFAQADAHGKITFAFRRQSTHVQLSGLAVGRVSGKPAMVTLEDEESCRGECARRPSCSGFEFSGKTCAIWSAPVGSVAYGQNSKCVAVLPEHVYGSSHTGGGGDGKRWRRGPGGLKGTDVGNGETGYTTGPYELVSGSSREACEQSCGQRGWCAGFAYKHTAREGSRPDWQLGACQLVGRLISGTTKVKQVTSYSKVGTWLRQEGQCQASPSLDFITQGHCATGQIYGSAAWALSSNSEGRHGFHSAEYASWVLAAWRLCRAKDPKVAFVSVWTDAGYRCYKAASCIPKTYADVRSWSLAGREVLSSLKEQSFQTKAKTLSINTAYQFTLANGYDCKLRGWTHTRSYAKGFLRNQAGSATATVSGLAPRALYVWKVYQYASSFAGKNFLHVNGQLWGRTSQAKSDAPTAGGLVRADKRGQVVFKFSRNTHHVHLSGLAIRKLNEGGAEALASLSASSFLFRKSPNRNLAPSNGYVQTLSNGYACELKGWTHSRKYAKGFLRNRKGTATALLYGLEPGSLYAWKVYQYASAFAGKNLLKVNGLSLGWTYASRSSVATKTGAHRANEHGQILFEFPRTSRHVHLSGLAFAKVFEDGDGYLSRMQDSNFNDRGDTTLRDSTTYKYLLGNGYPVALKGWTHTRRYAYGFLRNKKGSASAVVSGLKPKQLYAFKLYQYAQRYGGWNEVRVNGGQVSRTKSIRSSRPTLEGLAMASSKGTVTFEFTRKAVHLQLSGLAIGEVRDKVEQPAVEADKKAKTVEDCKRSCEKKSGCRGVQYDSSCTLWMSPISSVADKEGAACHALK
ncbi:unnamed protein product [Effrenium voratum]|nr:unnamed protein product [Effrenium voratum]